MRQVSPIKHNGHYFKKEAGAGCGGEDQQSELSWPRGQGRDDEAVLMADRTCRGLRQAAEGLRSGQKAACPAALGQGDGVLWRTERGPQSWSVTGGSGICQEAAAGHRGRGGHAEGVDLT